MTYQFDFSVLIPYWEVFLRGCAMTLLLAAVSTALGLSLGLLMVIAKRSRFGAVSAVATCYIEVTRNTPFLVQVLFIFFGLPELGLALSPQVAAVLALTLNLGAFSAEIIRGGIDAIPKGQFEAGAALGLSPLATFRHIVLRPALRIIFPALSGQFVLLLLTTSIVSSISAEELTSAAQSVDSLTFRSFEVYIATTFMYLLMSLIFAFAFKAISRACFSYPSK